MDKGLMDKEEWDRLGYADLKKPTTEKDGTNN
jgi:hypothetical protein